MEDETLNEIGEILDSEASAPETNVKKLGVEKISIFSAKTLRGWLYYCAGWWLCLFGTFTPVGELGPLFVPVPLFLYSVEMGIFGRCGALQGTNVINRAFSNYLGMIPILLFGILASMVVCCNSHVQALLPFKWMTYPLVCLVLMLTISISFFLYALTVKKYLSNQAPIMVDDQPTAEYLTFIERWLYNPDVSRGKLKKKRQSS